MKRLRYGSRMRAMPLLLAVLVLVGVLVACEVEESGPTEVALEPTGIASDVATVTPSITSTSEPTAVTVPTSTAVPTTAPDRPTLTPTATPEAPTPTSVPTATPVPPSPTPSPMPPTPTPTQIPQPISYSGSGDDVIVIQKPGDPDDPVIVYAQGNSASRHFALKGYDSSGGSTGLLVNTTRQYEGTVPLDFRSGRLTTMIEVTANGEWYIEIRPLASARVAIAPGTFEGWGDEVFLLVGTPSTAYITGNDADRHFAVVTYGSRSNLAVNTTDPYAGRVIIPSDTIVVEVSGEGPWTIEFE